ncbi:unnamed protein product [Urochloa humidicola]
MEVEVEELPHRFLCPISMELAHGRPHHRLDPPESPTTAAASSSARSSAPGWTAAHRRRRRARRTTSSPRRCRGCWRGSGCVRRWPRPRRDAVQGHRARSRACGPPHGRRRVDAVRVRVLRRDPGAVARVMAQALAESAAVLADTTGVRPRAGVHQAGAGAAPAWRRRGEAGCTPCVDIVTKISNAGVEVDDALKALLADEVSARLSSSALDVLLDVVEWSRNGAAKDVEVGAVHVHVELLAGARRADTAAAQARKSCLQSIVTSPPLSRQPPTGGGFGRRRRRAAGRPS